MTDKSVILDTPDQIAMFRLLQIRYALDVEIKTGMKHSRGSMLRLANSVLADAGYGNPDKPFHRKTTALEQLKMLIADRKHAMHVEGVRYQLSKVMDQVIFDMVDQTVEAYEETDVPIQRDTYTEHPEEGHPGEDDVFVIDRKRYRLTWALTEVTTEQETT